MNKTEADKIAREKYPYLQNCQFNGHITVINKEWSDAYQAGDMHLLADIEARRDFVQKARAQHIRNNPKKYSPPTDMREPRISRSYNGFCNGEAIDDSDYEFY